MTEIVRHYLVIAEWECVLLYLFPSRGRWLDVRMYIAKRVSSSVVRTNITIAEIKSPSLSLLESGESRFEVSKPCYCDS